MRGHWCLSTSWVAICSSSVGSSCVQGGRAGGWDGACHWLAAHDVHTLMQLLLLPYVVCCHRLGGGNFGVTYEAIKLAVSVTGLCFWVGGGGCCLMLLHQLCLCLCLS